MQSGVPQCAHERLGLALERGPLGIARFADADRYCQRARWAADLTAAQHRRSQFAFPEAACNEVFAGSGYESSAANLARIALAGDIVFRDGVEAQMATMSGNVASGFRAMLTVAV